MEGACKENIVLFFGKTAPAGFFMYRGKVVGKSGFLCILTRLVETEKHFSLLSWKFML